MRRTVFGAGLTFLTLVAFTLAAPRSARAQVLDFEGLQTTEEILDYYNGGFGSLGSGPGPNFGVTFGNGALAANESHPSANWANTPSGEGVAFFLGAGSSVLMNVGVGFSTGFSFFYTSTTFAGAVNVYDGLNGTGTLLASLNLSALGACGGADPFCNWAPVGVTFGGTARSVDFSGVANQIGFDDITINSATPGNPRVPEPTTVVLLGTGLLGIALAARRRDRSEDDRVT